MVFVVPTINQNVPVVIDATAVDLSWTAIQGTGPHLGNFTDMEVWRNGALLATVPLLPAPGAGNYIYEDEAAAPSTTYTYEIRAGYDNAGENPPIVSNDQNANTPDLTSEFNCACETVSTFSALSELRRRMMIQIGYAAQAANPPPGMAAYCNEFLYTAQKQLYDKYKELRTERFFRWTMVPAERYYSLTAAEGSCIKQVDPKRITWVGFEDLNQAWYELKAGIDPLMYTRAQITTGWPTHFEVRSCIEIFPAPQAAYTLWVKAHFQLEPFAADGDLTTIDDELVLLYAVANAKSDRGKPDAQRAMSQATARLYDLTAANHVRRRYIPRGSTASPATPPKFLPLIGGQ